MSHFFTGDTIVDILPSDNPNEGRVKINYNFDLIEEVFGEAIHGVLSGHSITEGGTNINVVSGSTMGIPLYTVSLDDDISLNSVSANTISLESTTMAQVIMQPVNVAAPADGSMWFTTSGGTTLLNYQVTGTTKSVELT